MALIKFVSAFLAVAATAVTAVPTSSDLAKREDVDAFERGLGETIVFKRDDVLTPRDLELANLHGVNVSEMWKHSVIKRSDGDDYTIWVDNSFSETPVELPVGPADASEDEDSSVVEKRQQMLRTYANNMIWGEGFSCHDFEFRDDTGPNAPFTGGILHMASWAAQNRNRRFEMVSGDTVNRYSWRNLLVAGSNSGGNAILRGSPSMPRRANGRNWIGTQDIEHIARGTNTKFAAKFGNSWRARAWGPMWCDDMNSNLHWEASHWHITNSDLSSNPNWP